MKNIKMRYSIEPRDLDFRTMDFYLLQKKMGTKVSNKYATDAIKTTSKRALQKQQKQLVI